MADNQKRGEEALTHLKRELDSRDRKEKSKPLTVAALSAVVIAVVGGGIYFAATQNDGDDDVTAQDTTASSEAAESSETEPSIDPSLSLIHI